MKKLWIAATCFVLVLATMGQLKVSQYPNTNNASGTDLLLLSVPGVTNKNITVTDFRFNVIGQMGTNTIYIDNSVVTNLTTRIITNNYIYGGTSYITKIYTGDIINNNSYTTNIFASNVFVSNLVSAAIVSENTYLLNNFTTNLYVSNSVVNSSYITNLYVENPYMGLQQLTNVCLTNVSDTEVLAWNASMKKWTNTASTVTNLVLNNGLVQTNIAYTSNTFVNCSLAQNLLWMTNAMANHMCIVLTNMVPPQTVSVVVQGAAAFTNLSIYVFPNAGNSIYWLSITNGTPTVAITSNQIMQFDFMVMSSSTGTNVTAAWKESYR